MSKPRILYVLLAFPQFSETYIRTEIEHLKDEYDIHVISLSKPNLLYQAEQSFQTVDNIDQIVEIAQDFGPAVIHTHWLQMTPTVHQVSQATSIPFTVRSHSSDVLGGREKTKSLRKRLMKRLRSRRSRKPSFLEISARYSKDPLCLGILAFPFARPIMENAGVEDEKIIDCFPVVDVAKFQDRSPNGQGVMDVGAAFKKKKMDDFIRLARLSPGMPYRLYALGYDVQSLKDLNERAGNPVEFVDPIDFDDMPREYKRHNWLVYTADPDIGNVGWPMAVAEAQAAGAGVCLQRLRDDQEDYVGPGGFIFDDIEDVRDLVKNPVPDDVREMGFEQAKKSDVRSHIHLLTDLWRPWTHDKRERHDSAAQ